MKIHERCAHTLQRRNGRAATVVMWRKSENERTVLLLLLISTLRFTLNVRRHNTLGRQVPFRQLLLVARDFVAHQPVEQGSADDTTCENVFGIFTDKYEIFKIRRPGLYKGWALLAANTFWETVIISSKYRDRHKSGYFGGGFTVRF